MLEKATINGCTATARITPTANMLSRGSRNSNVLRGLLVKMTDINKRGRRYYCQLRYEYHTNESAETRR